jgi:hypothetical protein
MECGLFGLLVGACVQAATLPSASEAYFTARDRKELASAPYRQASISPKYQRQIVTYHRKEARAPSWSRPGAVRLLRAAGGQGDPVWREP